MTWLPPATTNTVTSVPLSVEISMSLDSSFWQLLADAARAYRLQAHMLTVLTDAWTQARPGTPPRPAPASHRSRSSTTSSAYPKATTHAPAPRPSLAASPAARDDPA